MRFVDLSHEIHDGLVTYPGLAGPSIRPDMSYDDSQAHYAAGYEFQIDRIDMIANTGTYLDAPSHRFRGDTDLADLQLKQLAGLDSVVVRPPMSLSGLNLQGKAVLFHTGWSQHWGTPQYGEGHPHLAPETADQLVAAGASLVGIDSLNVDATVDGTRPIHSKLLQAGIPIVEHLTNLEELPAAGARFYAVPPRVRGMGSFPVRAFATVADA